MARLSTILLIVFILISVGIFIYSITQLNDDIDEQSKLKNKLIIGSVTSFLILSITFVFHLLPEKQVQENTKNITQYTDETVTKVTHILEEYEKQINNLPKTEIETPFQTLFSRLFSPSPSQSQPPDYLISDQTLAY